jgi:hypothetical protein
MKGCLTSLAALLSVVSVGMPQSSDAHQIGAPATSIGSPQAAEVAPSSRRQAAQNWSEDGLEKIKVKGLDVVYMHPGASLASYTKVIVAPVAVSFRRNWERSGGVTGSRIRAKDAQRIRDQLGALVGEEMVKELASGGFTSATTPADDALVIEMAITDLYITAPDVLTPGRTVIYAVSAGEMTLVATLRDSVTGDIVMRVYDHERAHESMRMQRITNADNAVEARRMAKEWAATFRRVLELARPQG